MFVVPTRTLMGLASSSSSERSTFGTIEFVVLSLSIDFFVEDFLSMNLTLYFSSSLAKFESRVVGSLSSSAFFLTASLQYPVIPGVEKNVTTFEVEKVFSFPVRKEGDLKVCHLFSANS